MNENLNMEVIRAEYQKLVGFYSQIESINEEIKLCKESIKNEGANPSIIAKIALAAVKDKTEDIVDAAQDLIDLTEAIKQYL